MEIEKEIEKETEKKIEKEIEKEIETETISPDKSKKPRPLPWDTVCSLSEPFRRTT